MKTAIKTSITLFLCLFCAIAFATKEDSARLAEEIVNETKFDVYLKKAFEVQPANQAGSQNFDGLKEGIVNNLVEKYSEQQLQEIKKIFADERIKKVFIAYYAMWTGPDVNHFYEIFFNNLEQLAKFIQSPFNKPKYEKHEHYGQEVKNDAILNMLKLMDGLKGENALEAYKPWAQEHKDKAIEDIIHMAPVLAGQEKELSKVYDYSIDVWINYWKLKEDKKLDTNDFQAVVNAMESNEAFRQFFVEIYKARSYSWKYKKDGEIVTKTITK
jgi:hypothetical protein